MGSCRNKHIYLCLAHMSEDGVEQQYIKKAFDDNYVVPLGPNVEQFEKELERFVNGKDTLTKHVVALSSGTAALHLALVVLGVGAGDEVLVQSLTFCASVNPVRYLGANPVFVGSEPDSWNMDPVLLEKAIIDRKRLTGKYPKAIIPVTLYGMPYDCDRIMAIADKYGIPVIEDSAEGLGSRYKGRALGTFGKFGVLSFNGNKMITTSGGGALITEDEGTRSEVMKYATQCKEKYRYYHHEKIGYNYRMSNICAGIGIGQMTVLEHHIAHHRHVAELYENALAEIPGIDFHKGPDWAAGGSNYWLSTVTVDQSVHVIGQEHAYVNVASGDSSNHTSCEPNGNVEALLAQLEKAGIEARPLWKPMHKQPIYADTPVYTNGVEVELFKKGLCLPSGPCVSDDDVRYIVQCIKESIL